MPTYDPGITLVQGGGALPVHMTNAPGSGLSVEVTNSTPLTVTESTPTIVACGELAGVANATQLPNVAARYAWLTARSTNTGSVYIGGAGVTAPNNSTDTTTGIELVASATILIPIDNLNRLYYIGSDANQRLTYLVVR